MSNTVPLTNHSLSTVIFHSLPSIFPMAEILVSAFIYNKRLSERREIFSVSSEADCDALTMIMMKALDVRLVLWKVGLAVAFVLVFMSQGHVAKGNHHK